MMLENSESTIQAREAIMNLIKCGNFNNHEGREEKAAVFFSNGRVPIKRALAGLIVDWQLGCTKKEEVLKVLQFAKEFCAVESFMYFKKSVVDNLKMVGRDGMRKNIDYGKLAEKLFAELDTVSVPNGRGDFGGAGDPQSTLGSTEVSSFSGRNK